VALPRPFRHRRTCDPLIATRGIRRIAVPARHGRPQCLLFL